MLGENCSSSCVSRDHETFGECIRGKGLRVAYCNSAGGSDYTAQKRWDADLDAYKQARAQGIQPASTSRHAVDRAVALSEKTGQAYQA